jgi:hypothetical protein
MWDYSSTPSLTCRLVFFSSLCHGVSSVDHIHPVVGFDTMKKFVDLTHRIKPTQEKGLPTLLRTHSGDLVGVQEEYQSGG